MAYSTISMLTMMFKPRHGCEIFITLKCKNGNKTHLPLQFNIYCHSYGPSLTKLNKMGFIFVTLISLHMKTFEINFNHGLICIISLCMIKMKMITAFEFNSFHILDLTCTLFIHFHLTWKKTYKKSHRQ
jgi:hypothetical protein